MDATPVNHKKREITMKHISKISVPAKAALPEDHPAIYDAVVDFLKNPAGVATTHINALLAKLTPAA